MAAEAAATTGVWAVLLPVLVGGVLALLGSTIGPLVSLWWSQRASTQKLRIDRFEELVSAIHELEHWLEQKRNEHVFGGVPIASPSPLYRAKAICSVWFPDLMAPLKQIDLAVGPYYVWMLESAQKRIKGEYGSINDGFSPVYDPFYKALSEFHEAAATYAATRNGRV